MSSINRATPLKELITNFEMNNTKKIDKYDAKRQVMSNLIRIQKQLLMTLDNDQEKKNAIIQLVNIVIHNRHKDIQEFGEKFLNQADLSQEVIKNIQYLRSYAGVPSFSRLPRGAYKLLKVYEYMYEQVPSSNSVKSNDFTAALNGINLNHRYTRNISFDKKKGQFKLADNSYVLSNSNDIELLHIIDIKKHLNDHNEEDNQKQRAQHKQNMTNNLIKGDADLEKVNHLCENDSILQQVDYAHILQNDAEIEKAVNKLTETKKSAQSLIDTLEQKKANLELFFFDNQVGTVKLALDKNKELLKQKIENATHAIKNKKDLNQINIDLAETVEQYTKSLSWLTSTDNQKSKSKSLQTKVAKYKEEVNKLTESIDSNNEEIRQCLTDIEQHKSKLTETFDDFNVLNHKQLSENNITYITEHKKLVNNLKYAIVKLDFKKLFGMFKQERLTIHQIDLKYEEILKSLDTAPIKVVEDRFNQLKEIIEAFKQTISEPKQQFSKEALEQLTGLIANKLEEKKREFVEKISPKLSVYNQLNEILAAKGLQYESRIKLDLTQVKTTMHTKDVQEIINEVNVAVNEVVIGGLAQAKQKLSLTQYNTLYNEIVTAVERSESDLLKNNLNIFYKDIKTATDNNEKVDQLTETCKRVNDFIFEVKQKHQNMNLKLKKSAFDVLIDEFKGEMANLSTCLLHKNTVASLCEIDINNMNTVVTRVAEKFQLIVNCFKSHEVNAQQLVLNLNRVTAASEFEKLLIDIQDSINNSQGLTSTTQEKLDQAEQKIIESTEKLKLAKEHYTVAILEFQAICQHDITSINNQKSNYALVIDHLKKDEMKKFCDDYIPSTKSKLQTCLDYLEQIKTQTDNSYNTTLEDIKILVEISKSLADLSSDQEANDHTIKQLFTSIDSQVTNYKGLEKYRLERALAGIRGKYNSIVTSRAQCLFIQEKFTIQQAKFNQVQNAPTLTKYNQILQELSAEVSKGTSNSATKSLLNQDVVQEAANQATSSKAQFKHAVQKSVEAYLGEYISINNLSEKIIGLFLHTRTNDGNYLRLLDELNDVTERYKNNNSISKCISDAITEEKKAREAQEQYITSRAQKIFNLCNTTNGPVDISNIKAKISQLVEATQEPSNLGGYGIAENGFSKNVTISDYLKASILEKFYQLCVNNSQYATTLQIMDKAEEYRVLAISENFIKAIEDRNIVVASSDQIVEYMNHLIGNLPLHSQNIIVSRDHLDRIRNKVITQVASNVRCSLNNLQINKDNKDEEMLNIEIANVQCKMSVLDKLTQLYTKLDSQNKQVELLAEIKIILTHGYSILENMKDRLSLNALAPEILAVLNVALNFAKQDVEAVTKNLILYKPTCKYVPGFKEYFARKNFEEKNMDESSVVSIIKRLGYIVAQKKSNSLQAKKLVTPTIGDQLTVLVKTPNALGDTGKQVATMVKSMFGGSTAFDYTGLIAPEKNKARETFLNEVDKVIANQIQYDSEIKEFVEKLRETDNDINKYIPDQSTFLEVFLQIKQDFLMKLTIVRYLCNLEGMTAGETKVAFSEKIMQTVASCCADSAAKNDKAREQTYMELQKEIQKVIEHLDEYPKNEVGNTFLCKYKENLNKDFLQPARKSVWVTARKLANMATISNYCVQQKLNGSSQEDVAFPTKCLHNITYDEGFFKNWNTGSSANGSMSILLNAIIDVGKKGVGRKGTTASEKTKPTNSSISNHRTMCLDNYLADMINGLSNLNSYTLPSLLNK